MTKNLNALATNLNLTALSSLISIGDIRRPLPDSVISVYCGRQMPGHDASPLGNPLPLPGKRWTAEAERWARWLLQHGDHAMQALAQTALEARGWRDGVASGAYELVLREQLRQPGSAQLREIRRIAGLLRAGRMVKLLCWCNGASHCHTNVIRKLVLEELQADQGQTDQAQPQAGNKPALPVTGPYTAKDQRKWDRASKMIARGSQRSSSQRYAETAGSLANCGRYNASDVVFISAEGNRSGRIDPDWAEIQLAIDAGARFVTDVAADRNRPYNRIGEGQVAAFLAERGYRDDGTGLWSR